MPVLAKGCPKVHPWCEAKAASLAVKRLATLLAAGVILGSSAVPVWAEEEVALELRDEQDYGSGPSVMDQLYAPGGLERSGLFLGNPNQLNRADRVLLKYDLKPILLLASRIKSATLVYRIESYVSENIDEQLEVEHFLESLESLGGQELNRPDVESVALVKIVPEDAINGENGVRSVDPKETDVTAAVLEDIKKGNTVCSFRLRVPEIEGRGNNRASANGLIIARAKAQLPVLQIILKD